MPAPIDYRDLARSYEVLVMDRIDYLHETLADPETDPEGYARLNELVDLYDAFRKEKEEN